MKNSGEFGEIYKVANRWHCDSAVIFYKVSDENRAGFVASKKVGNAVKRNSAKRRLKALFYELQNELKSGTYVFIAKEVIKDIDYKRLKSSLLWSFRRLECLK
ncbi:MAG: ribonuclease P protein component [Campylobacteraceae bacterium]|nr:ribonuclease P protein component [Campylobacteraceae bacterium]